MKWSGTIRLPEGDIEIFFNFNIGEDKELTSSLETYITTDKIKKGVFKDDLNFTFEVFSEYAQQTINYAGKIVDDVIKLELVGFDIEIELDQVKEEK